MLCMLFIKFVFIIMLKFTTIILAMFILINPPSFADNEIKVAEQSTNQGVKSKRLLLAENNPVAALLCKAIRAFTGTVAKVIALLMLIGLAINLFAATTYNPVSPVTIVSLIIGATILFSADSVIGLIIGDAAQGREAACDCKYGIANCETI